MWPMGQLSDPYQQGEDDELGITISGLPGELLEPDPAAPGESPADAVGDTQGADTAGADDGTEPHDDDGEAVVFDLDDWSELERQAITDRLGEAGIPHAWQGTSLQVAAEDEAAVENILDIVEGESDEPDKPLDAERDQVAYDLSEWDDDHIALLVHELREVGVAHAWDGDEMYVYSEDEATVDDLFDKVSHPHELEAEDDDGTIDGLVLGDLFLAADRLQRDPEDPDGVLAMIQKGEPLDVDSPPYGIGKAEWGHLHERVTALTDLLVADKVDEEAVMASATELRTALRPFV
jgi:hypothetical protein